jgi:hypothetical protein
MITVDDKMTCFGSPAVEYYLGKVRYNFVKWEYGVLAYSIHHASRGVVNNYSVNGEGEVIKTQKSESMVVGMNDYRFANGFDKLAYHPNPNDAKACEGLQQLTGIKNVNIGGNVSNVISKLPMIEMKYGPPTPGGYKWIKCCICSD